MAKITTSVSQEIAFLPHFHWALGCCYADCAAAASEVIGESIHSSVEERRRQQGNWHVLYSYFRCSIRLMEALFQLMYHGLFDFDNLGHEFIWRGRRYSRLKGRQGPEGPFPMFQHLEQMDQYSPHSCEEEALLSKAKKGQAEKAAHHCVLRRQHFWPLPWRSFGVTRLSLLLFQLCLGQMTSCFYVDLFV